MSKTNQAIRKRKIIRVRKKISGSADAPRICLSKTNRHLYAQIINDETGETLIGISTESGIFKKANDGSVGARNSKSAIILANILGNFIVDNNIMNAKLDRRWSKYHGVVSIFADTIREKRKVF